MMENIDFYKKTDVDVQEKVLPWDDGRTDQTYHPHQDNHFAAIVRESKNKLHHWDHGFHLYDTILQIAQKPKHSKQQNKCHTKDKDKKETE